MANELKYNDITENIIGAAFEVYKFMGNACLRPGRDFRRLFINVHQHGS